MTGLFCDVSATTTSTTAPVFDTTSDGSSFVEQEAFQYLIGPLIVIAVVLIVILVLFIRSLRRRRPLEIPHSQPTTAEPERLDPLHIQPRIAFNIVHEEDLPVAHIHRLAVGS